VACATRMQASQACTVPSSAFLTPSTAFSTTGLAGLFRPAATSRVRSPGVSPAARPYELIARHDPHAVRVCPLPPVARRLQRPTRRLQGLAPYLSPLRSARGLAPRPTRSPPELSLPRVLLRAPSGRL
jgi:hypothetical protein